MLGCLIVARFLATIPFCTLCFRNSRELNFGTTRSILSIFDRIRYTLAKFQRKLVEFSQGKQTKTESGKLEFALEFSSSSRDSRSRFSGTRRLDRGPRDFTAPCKHAIAVVDTVVASPVSSDEEGRAGGGP